MPLPCGKQTYSSIHYQKNEEKHLLLLREMSLLKVLLVLAVLSVSALGFSVSGKKVAILQSKGGGHGEIGFALAKALMGENEVTILQDPACKRTAQPFCQYDSDLVGKGVKISDCDLSDAGAVCGALPGKCVFAVRRAPSFAL